MSAATFGVGGISGGNQGFQKGVEVGRKNWRLYVVILMALMAFNGFNALLEPRQEGSKACGSALLPVPYTNNYDEFQTMWGPSFSSEFREGEPRCPNTLIRANVEFVLSLLMVSLGWLALATSRSKETHEEARRTLGLPPPPDQAGVTSPLPSGPDHYCEECGGGVGLGVNFCSNCGTAQ